MSANDESQDGPASVAFARGQKIGAGRFTLMRPIGRGGMGEIWLAQDERLREPVALKFLPPAIRSDATALDDLLRETARSHKLTHPNIVRIFDLHEDGPLAFIAMEYVDGPNLASVRLQQPNRLLKWDFLGPVAMQLCGALEYAHGEKVIHRDIKPSNIMVDSRGRVKLADFGIAATVTDSMSRVSLRHATSGTSLYMSPQQMNGEKPRPTDDIYALGATLYELLTSKPPFHTGDIAHQVRYIAPPPVDERLAEFELTNDVPRHVIATIKACLAKDPAQRPQNAALLAEYLRGDADAKTLAPIQESTAPTTTRGTALTTSGEAPERYVSPRTDKERLATTSSGDPPSQSNLVIMAVVVLLVVAGVLWYGFSHSEPKDENNTGPQENAMPNADSKDSTATSTPNDIGIVVPPLAGPSNSVVVQSPPPTNDVVREISTPKPVPAPAISNNAIVVQNPQISKSTTSIDNATNKSAAQNPKPWNTAFPVEWPTNQAVTNTVAPQTAQTTTNVVLIAPAKPVEAPQSPPPARNTPIVQNPQPTKSAPISLPPVETSPAPSRKSTPVVVAEATQVKPLPSPPPIETLVTPAKLVLPSRNSSWVNSLGMRFVPVTGTAVLFAVTDTRVQDYQVFVDATGRAWTKPGFKQGPTHPAVNVSWNDAISFCNWLTDKEHAEGKLGTYQRYSLPSDVDWSQAVGLNPETGEIPAQKDGRVSDIFPWGTQWPPPRGAGNLSRALNVDEFDYTSPVGSFAPNRNGLFDMAGNVRQWCVDWYTFTQRSRVLRGSSWTTAFQESLLSSSRVEASPDQVSEFNGFRCVLVPGISSN